VEDSQKALILLRHNDLVWPLTLFPERDLYHLPRPIVESLETGNLDLQVIAVEAAAAFELWHGTRPETDPVYAQLHRESRG
jgi:hypothetical protein